MHDPVSFHTINPQQGHSVLPGLIINRHKIITLIGGGGKTGLMYLWARSLQAAGYSVVTTTTTKLSARDCPGIEFHTARSLSDAILLLSGEPDPKQIRTIHSGYLPAVDKLAGLPATWIDILSKEYPQTIFLVEGDGAARHSVKGHLPHEPVIPETSTLLIPVIGLDVLGKPVSAACVHRPEVFCHVTGALPGQPITSAEIHKVMFSPSGYLSHVPLGISIIPFLNKAENENTWKLGFELTQGFLAANYAGLNQVLIGSVHADRFMVLP